MGNGEKAKIMIIQDTPIRNASDEIRSYNDLQHRNKLRCQVCGWPWRETRDSPAHPVNDTCWRHRPKDETGETPESSTPASTPGTPHGADAELSLNPPEPVHSPSTVDQARKRKVCRVCGKSLWFPLLHIKVGSDYAHVSCLEAEDRDRWKAALSKMVRIKAEFDRLTTDNELWRSKYESEHELAVQALVKNDRLATECNAAKFEVERLKSENERLTRIRRENAETADLLRAEIRKARAECDDFKDLCARQVHHIQGLTIERDGLLHQLAELREAEANRGLFGPPPPPPGMPEHPDSDPGQDAGNPDRLVTLIKRLGMELAQSTASLHAVTTERDIAREDAKSAKSTIDELVNTVNRQVDMIDRLNGMPAANQRGGRA